MKKRRLRQPNAPFLSGNEVVIGDESVRIDMDEQHFLAGRSIQSIMQDMPDRVTVPFHLSARHIFAVHERETAYILHCRVRAREDTSCTGGQKRRLRDCGAALGEL